MKGIYKYTDLKTGEIVYVGKDSHIDKNIKRKSCKQGFTWAYQYYKNGKQKSIESVDIKKLEQKVKEKGLIWRCL